MKQLTTRKIALIAVMAALTAVCSGLRIVIPLSIGGTSAFHLGNIMCALSGILLGPWAGGLAAGLGSAIFDMTNPLYISECWLTFLMKGAYGVASGLAITAGGHRWNYAKALAAAVTGAVTYALIYLAKSYFYSGMLLAGLDTTAAWAMVIDKVPATIFNAAVAIIFAPILATAISAALKKNHLSVE